MTLLEALLARLEKEPERAFLMDRVDRVTENAFLSRLAARAAQLLEAGGKAGDRFLVPSGRGLLFWSDLLAVWAMGGVAVPISHATPEDHMAVILSVVEPRATLGAFMGREKLAERLPLYDPPSDSDTSLDRARFPDEADLAMISFTSGSTGRPKGVALSHKALFGNANAFSQALGPKPSDRMFFAIPYSFFSALSHFFVTVMAGADLVCTEDRLFLGDLYNAVKDGGANSFGGSPLQLRWLADCAASEPLNLRFAMSSGDRLSVPTIDLWRQRMPGTDIVTVYGLTELAGRFCMLPPALLDAHKGSVGKPIPGLSVKVLDEEGQALPQGETGEIYADGEHVFEGYYRDEEATRRAKTPYGMRTGDLGYFDDAGLLHVSGRADDIFKSHGEKVNAIPVAEALMATGLFADVAVVGYDDPNLGTIPKALYVAKEGVAVDPGQLARNLRGKVPVSHIPRQFAAVAAIPRTGSGKIKRRDLAQLAQSC